MPGSALLPDTQAAGTRLGGAWTRTTVAVETILSGRRIVTGDTLVFDNFNIQVHQYSQYSEKVPTRVSHNKN